MTHLFSRTLKISIRLCSDGANVCRYYRRNVVWRKPIRVLNTTTEGAEIVPPIHEMDFSHHELKTLPKSADVMATDSAIIPKSDQIVVPYEKLKKNDASFTKIIGIIKNRKLRDKSGKVLLEGKNLINDAIKAGLQLKALYFSREKDLLDIKLKNPEEVKVCKVLYQTMKVWSDLTTCPGIMGIFKRPSVEDLNILTEPAIPVTILCDNIREPGNLGSIIRNAAAVGCKNIFLTKGCVDPWEPKVLRSACGGHFRIPVVNNIEWSQISNYIPSNSIIFVADNSADIEMVNYSEGFMNFVEPDITETSEEIEETKYVTFTEDNQPIRIDESFESKTELEKYEDIQLPCYLYSAIKYPDKKNIVLYVGGETHGVDSRIVKLVCEFGGRKVKIPLENGVDSLNSAFAMTVILYEIKRQLSQLYISK